MATLVREPANQSDEADNVQESTIPSGGVPSPFPQHELISIGVEEAEAVPRTVPRAPKPAVLLEAEEETIDVTTSQVDVILEPAILPSIAALQSSCLTALEDLLLPPELDSSTPTTSQNVNDRLHILSASLQDTLVPGLMMIQRPRDSTALFANLQRLVSQCAENAGLVAEDLVLVQTLLSLLSHVDQLLAYGPSHASGTPNRTTHTTQPNMDAFSELRKHVATLQTERLLTTDTGGVQDPFATYETTRLWSRIDQDLDDIHSLCRTRAQAETASLAVPPEYEIAPPSYDPATYTHHPSDTKSLISNQESAASEKTRLDLEAVTAAIDRLYVALPQLHNQRVELRSPKQQRLLSSSTSSAPAEASSSARDPEADAQEMDHLLSLIGKASSRKLVDQSVVIDQSDMAARIQRATVRDKTQKDAFTTQLAEYSSSGRLNRQDAELRPAGERIRDPEALLTLPEFMREPPPPRPTPPPVAGSSGTAPTSKPRFHHRLSSSRTRSLSSPPLQWLLASSSSSSSRTSTPGPESNKASKGKSKQRPLSSGADSPISTSAPSTPLPTATSMDTKASVVAPSLAYVAEFHESLRQVRAFVTLTGPSIHPGAPAHALLSARTPDIARLHVSTGHTGNIIVSIQLPIPASPPTSEELERIEVRWSGTYYEFKVPTADPRPAADADPFADPSPVPSIPSSLSTSSSALEAFSAPSLNAARPSSWSCSSCSLPLVASSRISNYRDLPSEHWAELVDAWMCHSDQKLNAEVKKIASEGFEPEEREALVGGSYLLFNKADVVGANLVDYEQRKRMEDWVTIRCICGSIVGRRREVQLKSGSPSVTFRLAKYSLRPVSALVRIPPVPLTTFVVEDMVELQQAHASYRFILLDEEEERPRLLIWLFKPSLRLAYASPTQYQIPKTGSVQCAKILFQILGPGVSPNELTTILNKHPGFPQAERLLYPIHVCRRLAGMLRESSSAYPEGLRTMTGLDVGWLPR